MDITEYSDHRPISVKYRHGGDKRNDEETAIMTKDKKKIQKRSIELLEEIHDAENLEEIYEAFERKQKGYIPEV